MQHHTGSNGVAGENETEPQPTLDGARSTVGERPRLFHGTSVHATRHFWNLDFFSLDSCTQISLNNSKFPPNLCIEPLSVNPRRGEENGPGEIQGPIASGVLITLPEAQSYEDGELEVFFNGKPMEELIDFNIIGAGPTRTQISFTFDIQNDDIIRLKVDKK